MTRQTGKFVTSVKCWNCDKTGLVIDSNDPEKQTKCEICAGTGFITTKGTLST